MHTDHSRLILGIDTGGTYTDAAICLDASDHLTLLESAKSRTTKDNLTIGIQNAVANLPSDLLKQISRVSLSTTLATNACVENIGKDVTVVFVDSKHSTQAELYTKCGLPSPEQMIFLPGIIHRDGSILEEPSREEILSALKPVCTPASCIAISGLFSVRNAALEYKVAEIARELGASVVCGRDIAPEQLNYIKRAATAMLNGRLQSIICEFLNSVEQALKELHIDAPIDIVRSDGNLMSREYALNYPVETLLCGPAASVSGIMNLLPETDCLIADIGGTTTDLSLIHNGKAVHTTDGVNIGSYRTCVQSVFVETLGLGGDTRLYVNRNGELTLDQKRAIPLCVLVSSYPELKQELLDRINSIKSIPVPSDQETAFWQHIRTYEYRVLNRQPSAEELLSLSETEKKLCCFLSERPHSVSDCLALLNRDVYVFQTDHLEHMGIIQKSAFTLTDILHITGEFTAYDAEASRYGAWFFRHYFHIDETEFCTRCREMAEFRLYRAIVKMCLTMEHPEYNRFDDPGIEQMIKKAFYGGSLIASDFRLPYPLAGAGAAASAFLPKVAKQLHTTLLLPEGSSVANAIGAAACRIRAKAHRDILCDMAGTLPYQVCGGKYTVSFQTYEEALEEAILQAKEESAALARNRGILGELTIQVQDKRKLINTETPTGTVTYDFGGSVDVIAEAKVSKAGL